MRTDLCIEDDELRNAFELICTDVAEAGGRALLVGGSVRDSILGLPEKDLDIEVYGLEAHSLLEILGRRFEIDLVGQAFGVVKIHHLPIDISIPRRESKAGRGHKEFAIACDPYMRPEEAASRRDFTMNAIALDPLTNEIIDPFSGIGDLHKGLLRHTSEKFSEDPLRVLRGMQFAARFDLEVAPETIALCQGIECEGLARERIFDEWKKLILTGKTPSRGLQFLRKCGWIEYYPELEALIGCKQDPKWHPEGDVWVHTLHCMDAFAQERIGKEQEDLIVGFATLCHDLGKPSTTKFEDGRIRSKGHERAGVEPTQTFLSRMTNQSRLGDSIIPLVSNHLRPVELFDVRAGDGAIRRLARRVKRIDRLVRVARADQMGRPPITLEDFPAGDWLMTRARELEVEDAAPTPIMMGRHLILLGLEAGPHFGPILESCYQAQIEGTFATEDEGIDYAKRMLARK